MLAKGYSEPPKICLYKKKKIYIPAGIAIWSSGTHQSCGFLERVSKRRRSCSQKPDDDTVPLYRNARAIPPPAPRFRTIHKTPS